MKLIFQVDFWTETFGLRTSKQRTSEVHSTSAVYVGLARSVVHLFPFVISIFMGNCFCALNLDLFSIN
jgi:hypothetical protein